MYGCIAKQLVNPSVSEDLLDAQVLHQTAAHLEDFVPLAVALPAEKGRKKSLICMKHVAAGLHYCCEHSCAADAVPLVG